MRLDYPRPLSSQAVVVREEELVADMTVGCGAGW